MVTSTPVEPTSVDVAVERYGALADPTRLRVLAVLADASRCVCDVQAALDVAPNLLSYHLRVLREAGLIVGARRGRWVDYWVAPGTAALVADALAAAESVAGLGPHSTERVRNMTATDTPPTSAPDAPVLERLPVLDRFLPVWIGAAMLLGLALGRLFSGLNNTLDAVKVGTVSLPIALGLFAMMYPVLAKVRYDRVGAVARDRRLIVPSLLLNWVIGPALMFALAWLFLPDLPAYRTGLIIVGLARCIAMVLIWNDLAGGDREAAAVLVALNSLFQILAYSLLGYFYLELLPGWLGLDTAALHVSLWEIARIVAIFLGVPLAAGYLTRRIGVARRGTDWYEHRFLPRIAPVALWGLLFTVVILFALQGEKITANPFDVARIALPLLAYFALMWGGSFALGYRLRLGYPRTDHPRVHRRRQQLRTRDRGRDRRVRRHLRRSARRRRRPPHRSPRTRCARLRRAMGTTPLLPDGSAFAMTTHDDIYDKVRAQYRDAALAVSKAYGLDMTDDVLARARANAEKVEATNVEFLEGQMEAVPLPDASVDVIISNCVVNLSPDKPAVFAEMHRVLRPGGRIGISDGVAEDDVSAHERAERGNWVGCIAGALGHASCLVSMSAMTSVAWT